MHIVQLANFASPTSGGLGMVIRSLRTEYERSGHHVTTIVPDSGPGTEERAGTVTISAPSIGNGYRMVVSRRRLFGELARLRPDAVEISDRATMLWAADWAARAGIPSIMLVHERLDAILAGWVPKWVPLRRVADRWNRSAAGRVNVIVCPSEFAAAEFDRIGAPVARVPWGVDLTTFRPRPMLASPRPHLISVGRLSREKRPELAVEAVRVLVGWGHDVTMTFVGGGPLYAELRRRAAGLPVTFTGHVSDRDTVARLLASADVAIAASPAECFGLAVLEALAAGVPVVVNERSGAAEVVTETCGIGTTPSPRAIARATEEIMARDRQDSRHAARARAEGYQWSTTAHEILCLVAARRPVPA